MALLMHSPWPYRRLTAPVTPLALLALPPRGHFLQTKANSLYTFNIRSDSIIPHFLPSSAHLLTYVLAVR